MSGDDYNNFFSPDYWTPEGYQKRRSGQQQAAHKLAIDQDQSNRDAWGNIGNFFGQFGRADDGPIHALARGIGAASALPQQLFGNGADTAPRTTMSPGTADLPSPGRGFFSPGRGFSSIEKPDPLEELRQLLNKEYSGSPVDTSFMQGALDSQIAPINEARTQARNNFNTSDANLKAMHDAFRNEVLGQAPAIQKQNANLQGELRGIFDSTLQDNATRQAANKQQDAEMYARLGIAPAARQQDLVGQAIEQGNQRATDSRDSRLAEGAVLGNNELTRNTAAATAIGAEGLQRRSDLNMRLQEILGNLGNKEADVRSSFQQAKGDAAKEQEQRQYERFLRDRDFNLNRYNDLFGTTLKQSQQAAQGPSGYDGLVSQTDPQVVQAVTDVLSNESGIDLRDPNQVMIKLKQKYPNLNPDEAFRYLSRYNNLGTEKF